MCGGDANKQEYTIPKIVCGDTYILSSDEIPLKHFKSDFDVVKPTNIHLCEKCEKNIGKIMEIVLEG